MFETYIKSIGSKIVALKQKNEKEHLFKNKKWLILDNNNGGVKKIYYIFNADGTFNEIYNGIGGEGKWEWSQLYNCLKIIYKNVVYLYNIRVINEKIISLTIENRENKKYIIESNYAIKINCFNVEQLENFIENKDEIEKQKIIELNKKIKIAWYKSRQIKEQCYVYERRLDFIAILKGIGIICIGIVILPFYLLYYREDNGMFLNIMLFIPFFTVFCKGILVLVEGIKDSAEKQKVISKSKIKKYIKAHSSNPECKFLKNKYLEMSYPPSDIYVQLDGQ